MNREWEVRWALPFVAGFFTGCIAMLARFVW